MQETDITSLRLPSLFLPFIFIQKYSNMQKNIPYFYWISLLINTDSTLKAYLVKKRIKYFGKQSIFILPERENC